MIKRRRQDIDANHPQTTTDMSLPLTTTFDMEPKARCNKCSGAKRLWRYIQTLSVVGKVVLCVSIALFVWWFVRQLLYWIPRIEKPFEPYPYWRALIFNPLRYAHAKYFDSVYPKSIRKFVLTSETSFVVNLERSTQRLQRFRSVNRDEAGEIEIQRFPAHEWSNDPMSEKGKLQKYWMDQYPFLAVSAAKGSYGDVGCSLSHLQLWKEKLLDGKQDYLFVFEDDVRLLEPLLRRSATPGDGTTNHPVIEAPDVADMVFLAPFAFKRVNVSWSDSNEPAVRLLGGFGTMGYIITKEGAEKTMKYIQTSRQPLDILLFAAASMRIFLPVSKQWPAVSHDRAPSARLGLNQKE